jgi:hypothetical protein
MSINIIKKSLLTRLDFISQTIEKMQITPDIFLYIKNYTYDFFENINYQDLMYILTFATFLKYSYLHHEMFNALNYHLSIFETDMKTLYLDWTNNYLDKLPIQILENEIIKSPL